MNVFIYFLLISIYIFGAGENRCTPRFDVPITIQLLDRDGNVVPDAEVYVTFLLDGSVSPERYLTIMNRSDIGGKAGFRIFNNQNYKAGLDCYVAVEVRLYNRTIYKNARQIDLENYFPNYLIVVDAYRVRMNFFIDNNSIVLDRLILYGDYEINNVSRFDRYVPKEFWGIAVYRNLVRNFNYTLKKDSDLDIHFSKISYYISSLDDARRPIKCNAIINNEVFDVYGPTEIQMFDSSIRGILNCSGKIREIVMDENRNRMEFVIDVTPPVIEDLRLEDVNANNVLLAFIVYDSNPFHSGLDAVTFKYNSQTLQPEKVIASTYYYRIPNEDGNIYISAMDRDKNVRELNAEFKKVKPNVQTREREEPEKRSEDPISWFVLLIGIIVLGGIIYYIYNMYRSVRE
ncbi:MAG: hypothetical protein NZ908_02730 [Candidatus Micrarchaeota archaeon]|nr:hypothetical protein [Candidatus Micrarchaeota archaeon]